MRLCELLKHGAATLQQAGVEAAELEARLLLEAFAKMGRTEIYLHQEKEVDPLVATAYYAGIARREKREPLAYILAEREFWSQPFFVDPGVLIPRPETEFLVDRVLALADPVNFHHGLVVDLCCGSGVIAAVLAMETKARVIATDISAPALTVARKNILRHRLAEQVTLVQADLFSAFSARCRFSLVVSNPPYVRSAELAGGLAREVVEHEPHLALDGGDDGMMVINRIHQELAGRLCPGGQLFMEIGADQAGPVMALFATRSAGVPAFAERAIHQDYAGRDRVFQARLAGATEKLPDNGQTDH
jgi:release factor glutamine methyltransferase